MPTPPTIIVVDDKGGSIDYENDDWESQVYDNDTLGLYYHDTLTLGTTGAIASFTYEGSNINVVSIAGGMAGALTQIIEFTLDGQSLGRTVFPGDINSTATPYYCLNDTAIGDGNHTLVMNVLQASNEYPFYLDYIIYQALSGATPTDGAAVASGTSFPTQTGAANNGILPTVYVVSNSGGAPIGPIIGGVVGGLVLLLIALVAVWFIWIKHGRSRKPYFYASADAGDILGAETKAEPYAVPPPSSAPTSEMGGSQHYQVARTASIAPSSYSHAPSGLAQSAYGAPASEYSSSAGGSGSGSGSQLGLASGSRPYQMSSPNQNRSKAAEAGLLSVPEEATFHSDSGVRFDEFGQPQPVAGSSSAANAQMDVPPSYSAA